MKTRKILDISEFFKKYTEVNTEHDKSKDLLLERFRNEEDAFKKYVDKLSELEKVKSDSKIGSYETLSKDMVENLKQAFTPGYHQENIKSIEKAIEKMKEHSEEVSKLSTRFKQIKNMWSAFLERNPNIDASAAFIKDLEKDVMDLRVQFDNISRFEDLTRVEEATLDISKRVQSVISMMETLSTTIVENEFIGKEPADLKKRINEFITEGYKTLNSKTLTKKYLLFQEEVNFYKMEATKKRVKVKVIKVMPASNRSIYNYAIEHNGILIHTSEKFSDHEITEDTGEYVYVDNFPVYGVVSVKEISEEMEVADDQFLAVASLQNVSFNMFIVTLLISAFIASMTLFGDLSPFYSILGIAGVFSAFAFFFKGLRYRINSKFDLPNLFYFHKISYIFVSIGDNGLNVQKVVPKLLINFNKITDNSYTVFDDSVKNPFDEKWANLEEEMSKLEDEEKMLAQQKDQTLSFDEIASVDDAVEEDTSSNEENEEDIPSSDEEMEEEGHVDESSEGNDEEDDPSSDIMQKKGEEDEQ